MTGRTGRKPLFKDPVVGTVVGVALLGASWWVLYDAWSARGRRTPLPVRVLGVPV